MDAQADGAVGIRLSLRLEGNLRNWGQCPVEGRWARAHADHDLRPGLAASVPRLGLDESKDPTRHELEQGHLDHIGGLGLRTVTEHQ